MKIITLNIQNTGTRKIAHDKKKCKKEGIVRNQNGTWNLNDKKDISRIIKNIENIVKLIVSQNVDIVIINEFQLWAKDFFVAYFNEYGYTNNEGPYVPFGKYARNSVFIVSKHDVEITSVSRKSPMPKASHRWIEVKFGSKNDNTTILGIHIPENQSWQDKGDFWNCVIERAEIAKKTNEKLIIIGDFNTGLEIDTQGTLFTHIDKMRQLIDIGFIDAWNNNHTIENERWTWKSDTGKGFRLDYAFLSPVLAQSGRLVKAKHIHDFRDGKDPLTDHSALYVELDYKRE